MTAKPRGARRILTITHPDNTTSKRTTTADYLYAVERGPVDSGRWAHHLEMRALEADRQADNAEDLLTNGFKTLRRHRGVGKSAAYNDFSITVETLDRQTPDIGGEVYEYCNYERETSDYVRDADGNPVRDADGKWIDCVRPAKDVLREELHRLVIRRRETAAWLREQIAAGPSGDELTYAAVRWSKTLDAASKAAGSAEFAHLRAAGYTLTVVKVDQAHEGHEPGVYVSPAARQTARRAEYIDAVNMHVLAVPAEQADETPADEGAAQVTVIPDENDPAVEQVERSVCRYCHGRIVRRTHRPDTKWRHDKGDKGSPRGCTPFSQSEATPTAITAEYRVVGTDDRLADLAERFPVGTDVIVGSGERFTVHGHTAHGTEPGRVVTARGEWLAEECRPVRPVVHVDMTEGTDDRGSVLVTDTGRDQSPQAYLSRDEGVWSLDSEYTDNDGSVEPVRLSASTLPYVVNAFLAHLGLDPRDVDHRFADVPVIWSAYAPAADKTDEAPVQVSATLLDTAVMLWNADRRLVASRWQFVPDKAFASRMSRGRWVAVIEVNDDRDAYDIAVVDVLTAREVRTARFVATLADVESKMGRVLDVADRMLREVASA